jgi:TetR/AcrR family transcriptional repressor of nem operon
MVRYPPAETAAKHRKILDEAGRAFREKGFSGVSVAEIMQATGLTHGPFYNHFASKDALIEETLEDLSATLIGEIRDRKNTQGGIREFFHEYLSTEHRDDTANGCVLPALVGDVARTPRLNAMFASHIEKMLTEIESDDVTRRQALEAVILMVGAVALARAVGDTPLSEEILREAGSTLARMPEAG